LVKKLTAIGWVNSTPSSRLVVVSFQPRFVYRQLTPARGLGAVATPSVEPGQGTASSSSSSSSSSSTPSAPKEGENQCKAPARSEYETTRAINMARNKVVLGILDKTVDSDKISDALIAALKHVDIELNDDDLKEVLNQ
jgi:hypothetical protein